MKVIYVLNTLLVDDLGNYIVDDLGNYIEMGGWTGEIEVSTYTLFDLTYRLARELEILEESTAATGLGDKYAIASKRIPHHVLVQGINNALFDLGTVQYTDTTSLTSASNQTEYTLPLAAKADLREVWQQGITTDSNDNPRTGPPHW